MNRQYIYIYSDRTVIFATATLLKSCNTWNFYLQQHQVHPNLRGRLASFLMLVPVFEVSFFRLNSFLLTIRDCLDIIFLKYDPPQYLHLIRFVALQNEHQNPKRGQSASGAERPILIPSIGYLHGTRAPTVCYVLVPRINMYQYM